MCLDHRGAGPLGVRRARQRRRSARHRWPAIATPPSTRSAALGVPDSSRNQSYTSASVEPACASLACRQADERTHADSGRPRRSAELTTATRLHVSPNHNRQERPPRANRTAAKSLPPRRVSAKPARGPDPHEVTPCTPGPPGPCRTRVRPRRGICPSASRQAGMCIQPAALAVLNPAAVNSAPPATCVITPFSRSPIPTASVIGLVAV